MQTHYHEHEREILAWPWRWFCRKWARLLVWSAAEQERREADEREREFAKLSRAHEERWGR